VVLVDVINGAVIGKVETGREKAAEGEKGKLIYPLVPRWRRADCQSCQGTQLLYILRKNAGHGPDDPPSLVYAASPTSLRATRTARRMEMQTEMELGEEH